MARNEDLTDEQWTVLCRELPKLKVRRDQRGRPWRSNREVLNGILWILRSGARWGDLPDRYPAYQTCHRRFQSWVKQGIFRKILEMLGEDLQQRGRIGLSECFIDGSFSGAKRGAQKSAKQSVARAPNS